MTKVFIATKVIDGVTFISIDDMVTALQRRAAEYDHQADLLITDTVADQLRTYAYRYVAKELRERAEVLAFAAIAHYEENLDDEQENQ